MPNHELHGIRVLITRPQRSGEPPSHLDLQSRIIAHGGRAESLPLLAIVPPLGGVRELAVAVAQLHRTTLAIFTSVHAVRSVASILEQQQLAFPPNVRVAAIGTVTAKACEDAGIAVDFIPKGSTDSEGLVRALADFPLDGAQVAIFRAQSGRRLLPNALRQRGAEVKLVRSYHRCEVKPPLSKLRNPDSAARTVILLGSVSALEVLFNVLKNKSATQPWRALTDCALLAYSERIAAKCRAHGFEGEIAIAEQPSDDGVLAALLTRWGDR